MYILWTFGTYDCFLKKKIGNDTRVHIGIWSWDCHEQPWLKTKHKTLAPEEVSPWE